MCGPVFARDMVFANTARDISDVCVCHVCDMTYVTYTYITSNTISHDIVHDVFVLICAIL